MTQKQISGRKSYEAMLDVAKSVSPFTLITLKTAFQQSWQYDQLPDSTKQLFRLLTVKLLQAGIVEPGVDE